MTKKSCLWCSDLANTQQRKSSKIHMLCLIYFTFSGLCNRTKDDYEEELPAVLRFREDIP